jgi:hypothetical protein
MHLDAKPAADGLEIDWDRSASVVANATGGTLWITDGPTRKKFELTAAEIRSGKFSYPPVHRDVLIRLNLSGNGVQTSGDSLRYVSVREAAPERAPSPPPSPIEPAADRAVTRPVPAAAAIPPAVVHDVQPEIPAGIRARIAERVVVPVDVVVSPSGQVTGVTPEGDGDGLYRYLANRAATAARQWRFSPARSKEGKPVATKKTIYFDFAP